MREFFKMETTEDVSRAATGALNGYCQTGGDHRKPLPELISALMVDLAQYRAMNELRQPMTNDIRAERARRALIVYAEKLELGQDEFGEFISDLICDLLHLAHHQSASPTNVATNGIAGWIAETIDTADGFVPRIECTVTF
jgi:hypothetical protein